MIVRVTVSYCRITGQQCLDNMKGFVEGNRGNPTWKILQPSTKKLDGFLVFDRCRDVRLLTWHG